MCRQKEAVEGLIKNTKAFRSMNSVFMDTIFFSSSIYGRQADRVSAYLAFSNWDRRDLHGLSI